MVDALHTPGPWHVENRIHVKAENGWLVATASVPSGRVGSWGINPADNARLIAAAPELLEALGETWRVLRAAGLLNLTNGVQLGQTSWYVKICDAERLSDAAIAKATGDHP